MKILAQGAEAIIYDNGTEVIKERISKDYRIPEIDRKLIKSRTRREAKVIEKLAGHGIRVPEILKTEENRIWMEKIDGEPLKTVLCSENAKRLMVEAGQIVGRMHGFDVVHGDLTTMNFIFEEKSAEIVLLDFGLSFFSSKDEDKAVDLYVFERALKCGHCEEYLGYFYDGYRSTGAESVLKRLESVRKRGRKREEAG